MNSTTKAEVKISPHDPQPGIGDNGGPPFQKLTSKKKVERIKEVLDMDISAAQKCIGIRIIADADTDGMTPELSTEDLKRSASVKDRETVYRATKKLDERKVAKAFKEDGRPNRYLVLPSEAIDAALDEIDATSRVQPDPPHPIKPDGYKHAGPVGLNPTTPTSLNPTGAGEPDGIRAQDVPAHTPAPADITSHGNKESSSKIVTTEELASKLASSAREQADEVVSELSGLNGSAEPMLADILGWLGPGGSIANARQWLASTLGIFGQEVTAQSYHKLKTDLTTGRIFAHPIQAWTKIAQRMKAEPKSAASHAKDTQAEKRARIRQHVEETQAKMKSEKQWNARS